MLKKSIFFFLSFFCCLCVQAQHITYPESVKQLMEQADAKAVFRHDRNLTDQQLRALAAKGGLVMVYIVPNYMNPQKADATLDDFMDHLLHCIKIAGIDHVGISCDFDGGGGGWGLNGDNDVINITVRLLEAGFSNQDIAKLWSDNFFHVLETARQKVNN